VDAWNVARLIDALERGARAWHALLEGLPRDLAERRPTPREWSVLEIACHLVDEEREDFRARLRGTLEDPQADWTPIDPEGWVAERGYAQRELADVLASFLTERAASVAWLRSLDEPDWERSHAHPTLGPLRAGDLLASWVAHDALHLRQLARRLYQAVERDSAPYSPAYAGPWKPNV